MELRIYRSLWGYPGDPTQAIAEIKQAGYEGVEADLPLVRDELLEALRDQALGFVPLIHIEGDNPREQLASFRKSLDGAIATDPDFIVMHTGRDVWPLSETVDFYRQVVTIEQDVPCLVAHETHRTRALMSPWATTSILDEVPQLRLCCDFSHWVVVCERLLEDQGPALERAMQHAAHIHARVGSIHAPQVADPDSTGSSHERSVFERWWEMTWSAQVEVGLEVTTLTPEYGPPPYQPLTGDPRTLSSRLSSICDTQASRLRARFDRFRAEVAER
jgi:sugar phosphate isomerase/epimerase